MAKKSFTKGLESLFLDLAEEKDQTENPLLRRSRVRTERQVRKTQKDRRLVQVAQSSGSASDSEESFKDALEAFFREELPDKVIQRAEEDADLPRKSHSPGIKAKGGIDSLIQGTIVRDQLELGRKDTSERVTLVFEKDHVDKLKTIARMEQKYLKNIVTELIQEFIRTYESEHGKIS